MRQRSPSPTAEPDEGAVRALASAGADRRCPPVDRDRVLRASVVPPRDPKAPYLSALSIAARNSGASGVTLLGKNATTRPSLPITYLPKFHCGRLPLCPSHV